MMLAMTPIFVGRTSERGEFRDWVVKEPIGDADGRAALLIGPAGMGKTALLSACESLCLAHSPERWYVQLIQPFEGGFVGS